MMYDNKTLKELQEQPEDLEDYDIPELKDECFDLNEYMNSNYDY